tara:strand:+ start:872 stop:1486 length:615 start_codon:yes stop_codon:yes gene_type:complete
MQNPINLSKECPLFPLTVNVLPGGYLPLQIFEPRYLDMIKQCFNQETGFCVVLLQPNKFETKDKENYPHHYLIGTYVEIVDFNQLENGLLGITVKGKFRAEVLDRRRKDDGLIVGNVIEMGEEEESVSLEPKYKNIWSMLKQISKHPEIKKLNLEINYNCSSSVIYNLASLLPLTPPERQGILESKSNISRLDHINQLVKKWGG